MPFSGVIKERQCYLFVVFFENNWKDDDKTNEDLLQSIQVGDNGDSTAIVKVNKLIVKMNVLTFSCSVQFTVVIDWPEGKAPFYQEYVISHSIR